MAGITKIKRKDGTAYRVEYNTVSGRKIISLPAKYSLKTATEVKELVERILYFEENNLIPDAKTSSAIKMLPDALKSKFAENGLMPKYRGNHTLGAIWEGFFKEVMAKPNTVSNYRQAERRFFVFFDPKTPAAKLNTANGLEFRKHLTERNLAEATIAGTIKRIRTVLNWAVKRQLLENNPFTDVPAGSFINKAREHFVSRDDYAKLLNACPSQEWRTILALCRIGGLRNPSETLALRWKDIDWENGKVTVHSSKTSHHEGKDKRTIPLFHELREELKALRSEDLSSPFVVSKYRSTEQNMRTHFQKIIYRAGLDQWERAFHNLRGSRSNELFSENAAHVASEWMGQSSKVAMQHYLHATENDFQRALENGRSPHETVDKTVDKESEK